MNRLYKILLLCLIFMLGASGMASAEEGLPAVTVTTEGDAQTYSLSIQVLVLMTFRPLSMAIP